MSGELKMCCGSENPIVEFKAVKNPVTQRTAEIVDERNKLLVEFYGKTGSVV